MLEPPSARPLSITIIACLYVLHALQTLFEPESVNFVLGIVISGWALQVHDALLVFLLLGTGIGVWQLSEGARRVAIGWETYKVVNVLLSVALPHTRARAIEGLDSPPVPAEVPGMLVLFCLLVIGHAGVTAWFLITRKAAFR